MSALSRPEFRDEAKAFEHLESIVWADGCVCPHCGALDRLTKVTANPAKRIREGLWRCGHCKGQFTAKIGTVFEHARLPLTKMLQAVYLMTSSKKGVSAHQLHRVLEITYKSAWFLAHRIREAMREGNLGPLGGVGVTVEVDETFIGREPGTEVRNAYHHKMKVLTLVERRAGLSQPRARSFVIDSVSQEEILPIVWGNIDLESTLMTDEFAVYRHIGRAFYKHGKVNHSIGQYVVGQTHTNTIEGYFSIFKRGMKGVYQHCSKKHLHRYLAEFDFRYSNRVAVGIDDTQRSLNAIKGIVGKRLTYRSADQRIEAAA